MARPLSPEKRASILTAASVLIANQGVGISTATIAKSAGVAEGTLFTYFSTKDELLNQLYLALTMTLIDSLLTDFPEVGSSRDRTLHLMSRLVEWGVKNQSDHRAKCHLRASDRISSETHRVAESLFRGLRKIVEDCLKDYINPHLSSFYIDSVLPGVAEITIEAILSRPKEQEKLTKACFELFWRGIKKQ